MKCWQTVVCRFGMLKLPILSIKHGTTVWWIQFKSTKHVGRSDRILLKIVKKKVEIFKAKNFSRPAPSNRKHQVLTSKTWWVRATGNNFSNNYNMKAKPSPSTPKTLAPTPIQWITTHQTRLNKVNQGLPVINIRVTLVRINRPGTQERTQDDNMIIELQSTGQFNLVLAFLIFLLILIHVSINSKCFHVPGGSYLSLIMLIIILSIVTVVFWLAGSVSWWLDWC